MVLPVVLHLVHSTFLNLICNFKKPKCNTFGFFIFLTDMNKFIIHQKLTMRYILEKVSEEEIFQMYLNIPVVINELFTAPPVIREDKNPTCSFYYRKNKLIFRDFHPSSLWGDCFDCVGYLLNLNPNQKHDMYQILLDIVARFPERFNMQGTETIQYQVKPIFTEKRKPIIECVFRPWNTFDLEYWSKIGNRITVNHLEKHEVYPCEYIYTYKNDRRNISYQYTSFNDPAYAYYEGTDEEGILNYRIYFPFRKRPRFFANNTQIQGLRQLKPSKYGLITKSKKDIICLDSFGLNSVAPAGEGIYIPKDKVIEIINNYTYKGTLLDYDNAGIRAALHYRKHYNLQPYFLTDKVWNRGKGYLGAKDVSDLNQLKGAKFTGNLIYSTIKTMESNANLIVAPKS